MASLTGKKIQNTYTSLLQVESGSIQDGLGNTVNLPTNQFSGSVLISSSVQLASDISGAFHHSASNLNSRMGQTEINTTNNQNAISRLTALTSSYAFTANISGSFDSISSSLAGRVDSNDTDITNLQNFSSSLDNTFATDTELTDLSSSIASRVDSNDLDITNLQNFSSSLDATFATDTEVSTAVSALNAATSSYAKITTNAHFAEGITVSGSITVTGSVNSSFGNARLIQSNNRISLQSPGSGSGTQLGNVSVQQLSDGSTRTLLYGDSVQIGAYNGEFIFIGNQESSSILIRGVDTVISSSTEFYNPVTGSFSGSFEGVALSKDTGSYALKTQISGSFNTLSASLASRITNNDTDIANRQLIVTSSSPTQNTYIIPVSVECTPSGTTFLTGSYETASILRLNYTGGNGTHTLTLPDATTTTNTYRSIRVISNGTIDNQHQVDLVPSASQNLDGGTGGFTFNRSYEGVMVWSDGTEWFKIQAKNV